MDERYTSERLGKTAIVLGRGAAAAIGVGVGMSIELEPLPSTYDKAVIERHLTGAEQGNQDADSIRIISNDMAVSNGGMPLTNPSQLG